MLFRSASGLSDGDAEAFLRPFDAAMPGFEALRADVHGLVERAEVLSAVELLADEGDEARRAVEADWTMRIRERSLGSRVVERRRTLKFRLERRGKRWTITGLEPAGFFAPPGPPSGAGAGVLPGGLPLRGSR